MRKAAGYIAGTFLMLAVLAFTAWLPGRLAVSEGQTQTPAIPGEDAGGKAPASSDSLGRARRILLCAQARSHIRGNEPMGQGDSIQEFDSGEMPEDIKAELERRFQIAYQAFLVDLSPALDIESQDSEFYFITNAEGETMRVWRYYCEWSGDWRNWVEIYIDADTLEVYYFYFSSGRESEAGESVDSKALDIYTAAEIWRELYEFDQIENMKERSSESLIASFKAPNQSAEYLFELRYYPESLFDFRVTMKA